MGQEGKGLSEDSEIKLINNWLAYVISSVI